jgi:hypothetical protein
MEEIDDNILPDEVLALWERNGIQGQPERMYNVIAGVREGDKVTAICTMRVINNEAHIAMFSENNHGLQLFNYCEEMLKAGNTPIVLRLASPRLRSSLMRRFFEQRGYVFNEQGTACRLDYG